MKRRLALTLALALVLAGCTKGAKPTPPPPAASDPPPASSSQGPAPPLAKGVCLTPPTDKVPAAYLMPPGKVAVEGLCEALVGSDAFSVSFTVPPTVDEAAVRAAVKVEGAEMDRVIVVHGQAYVSVKAGKPGDVVTVRLAGPVGSDGTAVDLGFRLTRRATPTISAEIRAADGTWAPLASGSTLPRAALAIRFVLSGSPNQQMIMDQIKQALEPRKDDASALAYQLDADGPDRILLSIPAPPPRLEFAVNSGPSPEAVALRPFYLAFYTGEKPRLVAFDPATGTERNLDEAPVDVLGSHASPDGKWIAVNALQGENNYGGTLWLLATADGSIRSTKMGPGSGYYWTGNRLIVPQYGTVQVMDLSTFTVSQTPSAAEYFAAISPDTHLLAGFSQDQRREDPKTFLAPTTIVVHDWQTGKDEIYKDVAQSYVHHSESPPSMTMLFSCDGTKLSFAADLNAKQWRTLDRTTGQVTDSPASPGCPPPAGPTRSNGWTFEQAQEWGPITLKSPDGKRVDAGSGWMLGWQPDGKALIIRWANGPFARTPGI